MGDVIQLRPPRFPGSHCDDCGKNYPDLRELKMSIMPSALNDYEVLSVGLTVKCQCGTVWTVNQPTKRPEK